MSSRHPVHTYTGRLIICEKVRKRNGHQEHHLGTPQNNLGTPLGVPTPTLGTPDLWIFFFMQSHFRIVSGSTVISPPGQWVAELRILVAISVTVHESKMSAPCVVFITAWRCKSTDRYEKPLCISMLLHQTVCVWHCHLLCYAQLNVMCLLHKCNVCQTCQYRCIEKKGEGAAG